MQAAEVESQVRLLEQTLEGTSGRSRPSPTGLFHQVTGSQLARWNPFDGTPAQMNGGPRAPDPIGQELGESSTELNHSCSQGRSKRACSPGSEAGWEEGGKEKRDGWATLEAGGEQRNGWAHNFTSLTNNNGDRPASDHRPSNGGNILMVSLHSSYKYVNVDNQHSTGTNESVGWC